MTKNVKVGNKVRIIAGEDVTGNGFHHFGKGAVVEVVNTTGVGGSIEHITAEGAFVSGRIGRQVLRHSDYEPVAKPFKKGDRLEVVDSGGSHITSLIGKNGSIVTALADEDGGMVRVSKDGIKAVGIGGLFTYRFKLVDPLALDTTKPLQLRTGEEVTLITTAGRGDYPLVGYVVGEDHPRTWKLDGSFYGSGESPLDLLNVKPKPVVTTATSWHNVYKNGSGGLYMGSKNESRSAADFTATSNRVGVKKVVNVLTEGQFDD